MSINNVIVAGVFAVLNIAAFSAHADVKSAPQTYTYGTHLDIQKVISLKEDNAVTCGIVEARMTYLDSAGQTRVLDYSKFADGCNNDN